MPTISRFHGITISMYAKEDPPPHFHARYGGQHATFGLDGMFLDGSLPRRRRRMVQRWTRLHMKELEECWNRANPSGAARYDRTTEVNAMGQQRYKLVDVTGVEVVHDYVVRLQFSDGCEGVIDLGPDLWGPIFEPIAHDYELFHQVRVDPEIGTIVWPNGADLAPEVLHAQAVDRCPTPA